MIIQKISLLKLLIHGSIQKKRNWLRYFFKKKIPIGSGLGGGSSNAASVLLILNHFYHAKLSIEHLKNIAKNLGADVPFF